VGGLSNVNMASRDAFVRLLLILEWKIFLLSSIAVKEKKNLHNTDNVLIFISTSFFV
jgi:hypothetical protein